MALQKGAIDLSWVVVRPALEGGKKWVLLSCLLEQSREGKQSWRVQLRRNTAECSTESQELPANESHPLLSL